MTDGIPGTVTVLGSINMDMVLRVAFLPAPGETVLARSAARHPGGKGANQAIAAARAGAAVRMIGAVGDDADGRAMLATLRGDGIDCGGVAIDPAHATGTAQVTVDEAGENQIVVVAGANAAAVVAPSDRDGVLLAQLELPLSTVASFLSGRGAQAVVVLNAAPFHAEARALLALADIVVVNEVELAGYVACAKPVSAADALQAARGLLSREGQTIVVTRGGAGAVAVGPHGILETSSQSVARVIDTTGAGDCFCGFLAAGLAAGQPIAASIGIGHRAAALAVGRPGAASSIPSRSELGTGGIGCCQTNEAAASGRL